jgi:CubicO group peptidase (beta-lactamase class C family)
VVLAWGSQSEVGDVLSSAKPVLSTLLLFAVAEGKLRSVDTPIRDFGWELAAKDRGITFAHLANMVSGYARPEGPAKAWSYNDYAIMLYQKTLFDRVFRADPRAVAMDGARLGALRLEDGLEFRATNRRMSASVRDFARIAWFWLNRGNWTGRQLLPRKLFYRYHRAHVPNGLPHTAKAKTYDYLGVGTYGGGSDHFTEYGAGIYGFNWWFNGRGRLHPDRMTWPDAPKDTFMSIGAGGNCSVVMPGLRTVLVCARGNWGTVAPGNTDWAANRCMKLLVEAVGAAAA